MADLSKADKIAFGYKKLKEFQQRTKKSESRSKKHGSQESIASNGNLTDATDHAIEIKSEVETNFQTISTDLKPPIFDNGNTNYSTTENINYEVESTIPNSETITPEIKSDSAPSIQSYFNDNSVSYGSFDQVFQSLTGPIKIEENLNENFDNVVLKQEPSIIETEELEPVMDQPPVYSNIENLTQLSNNLKSMIEPSLSQNNELEKRNQELVQLLNDQTMENEALKSQIQTYISRIQSQESQLNAKATEVSLKIQQELHPLKEQLEYQAKSIGMLIGERAELTAALEKAQSIIKEKITENEEVNCKLRASRHKANDLEREVTNLKANLEMKLQVEAQGNLQSLEANLIEANKKIEELHDDITELSQKLNAKSQECLQIKQELTEKVNELSINEVKLQQLCNNESSQLELQIDLLNKDKLAAELKINHLANELKSLSLEKEKSNEQYQQYVTQLNEQIKSFSSQNEHLVTENTRLQKRETELIAHIGNLEKDIQMLHGQKTLTHKDSKEFQELMANVSRLEKIIEDTNRDMGKEIAVLQEEKKDLITELDGRNKMIAELEEKIVELETDRPDAVRLVAAMESDKVAAAQAIKQNAKLQKQVEELQNKFMEFTERELNLTGKLESEQHLGQEILKQLRSRENEIELLQQEIRDKNSKIALLQQHTLESNQSASNPLPTNDSISNPTDPESDLQNCANCKQNLYHLEMTEAQQKLEERFKRTMEDVARLTDEKLQLEHLVLQLQSETETIGEYIALYQQQRGILNQRSKEKDEELRLLNADRKHIRQKLEELNNLVQQFVPNAEIVGQKGAEVDRVDKIQEIISEVYSSNLIDPKGEHCAHVCSYCSGQLITV